MIGSIAAGHVASAGALPTGEPLAVASTHNVPIDQATEVSVVGIRGVLSITTGETREVRVVSRTPGTAGAELSVGLWRDGPKLIVAPAPGAVGVARRIDIEVPRGFALAVDAADGSLVADLVGGTLTVLGSKDASARLRGTAATIGNVSGNVIARAVGGSLKVTTVGGSTDVEGEQSKLTFETLSGLLNVKAQKGDATVVGCGAGAELVLVGTSLKMTGCVGDVSVTSDAPVVFQKMEGSMQFDMNGGSLRVAGITGDVEFRGRDTQVSLESITGVLHIQGDRLKASVVDVGGAFLVEATDSSVSVDRAGDVVLSVDTGSVSIQRAGGAVKAKVSGADVHILEGMGPVTLEMDGGDGEVSWAAISGAVESTLSNAGGNLTVRFPAAGGCRVVAKSSYGRIENELERVQVADDFSSARGSVNDGEQPYVRITASGDIRLENARKAP